MKKNFYYYLLIFFIFSLPYENFNLIPIRQQMKPLAAVIAGLIFLLFCIHDKFSRDEIFLGMFILYTTVNTGFFQGKYSLRIAVTRIILWLGGFMIYVVSKRAVSLIGSENIPRFIFFSWIPSFINVVILFLTYVSGAFIALWNVYRFPFSARFDRIRLLFLVDEPSITGTQILFLLGFMFILFSDNLKKQLAVMGVLVIFLLLTLSATTYIGFFAVFMISLVLLILSNFVMNRFEYERSKPDKATRKKIFRIVISLIILLSFLVLIGLSLFSERFERYFFRAFNLLTNGFDSYATQDSSFGIRYFLTKSGMDMFYDNPVFGVGTGQYGVNWVSYFTMNNYTLFTEIKNNISSGAAGVVPRSFVSLILSEEGLVGFILFIIFLLSAIDIVKLIKTKNIGLYMIFGYILFTFGDGYSPQRPMFWFAVAFLSVYLQNKREEI